MPGRAGERIFMKIALGLLLIAFVSMSGAAQSKRAEQNLPLPISQYKLEKYSVGEDATSGYDYLVYKKGKEIVKIREVWNGGASSKPVVRDFYYTGGVPVTYAELSLTKRQYRSVARGGQVVLPIVEKCYLKDMKVIKWMEKDKIVPSGDPRWAAKEKEVIEEANGMLEFYPTLKDL